MAKSTKTKREEAEARQEKYDSLTHQQKVKRAKARRGESKKELERLAVLGKILKEAMGG